MAGRCGYASVLIDAGGPAARRTFDYSVPDELGETIVPGALVVVPFGTRFLRGLVVELLDSPAVEQTRPIRSLYRPAQYADPQAPQMARFIAHRYACSEIEAYRAVLPPAIGGKTAQTWRLADTETAGIGELPSDLAVVYGIVRAQDSATLAQIISSTGLSREMAAAKLRRLVEARLLVVDAIVTTTLPRRKNPLYTATPGAEAGLLTLRKTAVRQREVLSALLAAGEPLAVEGISGDVASVRGAIQRLVALDLVREAGQRSAITVGLDSLGGSAVAPVPTAAQGSAIAVVVQALDAELPTEFLLHGVTGSGKTEVYLQTIGHALARGRQALVLVPEISLTPQAVARFERRFPGQVALLHSGLPAGERTKAWRRLRAGEARIAVGPRSAVFAPLPELGLIVVDEEHEPSYKQDDVPRYDARAVARFRASLSRVPIILGSATPSLDLYAQAQGLVNAADGASPGPPPVLLSLPERVDNQHLPQLELVDMRQELKTGNRTVLSMRLRHELAVRLERRQQSILFLNRRGMATFVLCRECGHVVRCPSCDVSLVFHGEEQAMRCHYCGYAAQPPTACPGCGGSKIRYFGAGTQRVEQQVRELFPEAAVARLDSDVAGRRGRLEATLDAFARGDIDVLVGTQMIGKGLDVPGVTLVGVIAADTALGFPDFRAAERTFSLVTQVAGRAGRGDDAGTVIVQTYNPEHYSLRHAVAHDYAGFAREELRFREELGYPPFAAMCLVRLSGEDESIVGQAAEQAGALIRKLSGPEGGGLTIMGPSPSPLYRLQGRYRWNIVIKGRNAVMLSARARQALDALQAELPSQVRVSVDVDPQSVL